MQNNENRPGYKKTKVGWIPEDWGPASLKNVVSPDRPIGYGVVQTGPPLEDGIPCVRVVDLVSEDLCTRKMIRTSEIINRSYKRTILQTGDVMLALRGVFGCARLVTKELVGCNLTRGVALLSHSQKVNPSFLVSTLKSHAVRRCLEMSVNGSALKELPIGELRKIPIPLPSLPEQEAIAGVLECWDKAIRGYEKKIEKKRNIKKGLMQALLSGKRRLPGFGAELGIGNGECRIPEGWKDVSFGSVFTFLKTYAFSREHLTVEPTEEPQVYNIHYGDLHATYDGCILNCSTEERLPRLHDVSAIPDDAAMLQDGDLIIADASEDYEGICACIELQNVGYKLITGGLHTFVARDTKDRTALGYRGYVLKEESVSKELKRIATGVSVYGVSKTNLAKVRILLPTVPEQQAIVSVLSSADAEINALENKLAALLEQKRFLLNNLVTGTIRLPQFVDKSKYTRTDGDRK